MSNLTSADIKHLVDVLAEYLPKLGAVDQLLTALVLASVAESAVQLASGGGGQQARQLIKLRLARQLLVDVVKALGAGALVEEALSGKGVARG